MQHANSYYTLLELHFFTIYMFSSAFHFFNPSNSGTLFYLTAHITVHTALFTHIAHTALAAT
jgi:hypothetical protein